jgi:hypothetical protein
MKIWDYISACFDDEGRIPDYHEIAENVPMSLDDMDLIEPTIERFAKLHEGGRNDEVVRIDQIA